MADRFPLIVDSTTQTIKELPSGDNLDLTGSSIVNASSIISSGNVGIGEDTPLQALHVNSGTGNSAAIFESTDSTSQIWIKDSSSSSTYQTGIACFGDNLLFNNGGEKMRIDASGNVGIGTSSPQTSLSIETSGTQDVVSPVVTGQTAGVTYGGLYTVRDGAGDQRGLVFQTFKANEGLGERLRIDSSGDVGIGGTPSSHRLEVKGVNNIAKFYSDSTSAELKITSPTVDVIGLYTGTNDALTFGTADTERMRIDSSGTTTFTKSGGGNIRIAETASRYAEIFGYAEGTANGSTMAFHTIESGTSTSTERMRIDSSGNLLVGKTAADGGVNGGEIRSNGETYLTATSAQPLALNRKSTDGAIATFAKDGAAVGSIGCYNGVPYIGNESGTGGGIMFNGKSIEPTALGSSRTTGENDIGSINYRWRDLYLSNGIKASPTTQNASTSLELGVLNAGTTAYAKIDVTNLSTYDTNLRFFTNTSASTTQVERMRIDSNGLVGIGTSDIQHDAKLDISILDETYTNAHTALRLGSRTSLGVNEAALTFAVTGQALSGTIFSNYGYDNDVPYQEEPVRPSGYISFSNGLPNTGTGRIIFGGSQIGSTTLVEHAQFNPSGNLQFADGKGIDFSALTSPATSGTATGNVLNDYEEGTWTPTLQGSGGGSYTYTGVTSRYTKIGNLVTITAQLTNITTSGAGHSGYLSILGAPFIKIGDTFPQGAVGLSDVDFATGMTYGTIEFITTGTSTTLYIRMHGDNISGSDLQTSEINSGSSDITFSIQYIAT